MCRRLAAQEQHQAGKVLGLPDAPRRLAHQQRVQVLVHAEARHLGREHARADAVDHDVERRQLAGLHLGQVDAGGFGGAICEKGKKRLG